MTGEDAIGELVAGIAGEPPRADSSPQLVALITAGTREPVAATTAIAGALFDSATPPRGREVLAQAIAEIGSTSAAAVYERMLDDPDPAVRGRGAQGLAIAGLDAVPAWVRTIDDLPDAARYPFTLAVDALVAAGFAVVPRVLPLLTADSTLTRQRALLVLRLLAADPAAPPGFADAVAAFPVESGDRASAAARIGDTLSS